MPTVAERNFAKPVVFNVPGINIRGYDFEPINLNEEDREFVFRSLFPIGLSAFSQNPSKAMENDMRDHFFRADHLLVVRSDGSISFSTFEYGAPRPIGFRMWNTYETKYGKAVYLAGMCVAPEWQGTGIGQAMIRYVIETEKPQIVFTVTQNPIMKQTIDSALGEQAYPLMNGVIPLTLRPLMEEMASLRGVSIEPSTNVIRKHYGGSLYGRQPVSRDWRYERLFAQLDVLQGDAFLCTYCL